MELLIPALVRSILDLVEVEYQQDVNIGNYNYDCINSNLLAPPGTDNGDFPNAKRPTGLSSNRLAHGKIMDDGRARQQKTEKLPITTRMAGVNMRLARMHIKNYTGTRLMNGHTFLMAVPESQ